ncbi:hypothetical protein O181_059630 [Austropuccinia psidii MF-1]|uniref:Uncharacterized protein n=1 Tax=Austropuccinia psidii MF-1 TaxID=1389203 RepID=A0A9Q3EBT4_9BASI|nr:hypothetical protein [Austropuccinia psidii MF-1]
MSSSSSLVQTTLREARSLRRDAAKIIMDLWRFPIDADYIPTSKIPSELDVSALSNHHIKGEALEHQQQIISDTIIPSSWTRVPRKMGSPSYGSLKDAEWALLWKVYIPFLILSEQMSLDKHHSPNTQRKIGEAEELAN